MNNSIFEASYLGCVDYAKAVQIQENLSQIVRDKKIRAVIGLEHPAVVTLGHRLSREDRLTPDEHDNIPHVQSSRGGLATVHSEGQLVIYPVLNLRDLKWGVKQYVQKLLQTTQKLLAELDIDSQIDEQAIGLYTANGKIAFCGIQVKNGISLHGISLNVRNDLSFLNKFRHAGYETLHLIDCKITT